MVTNLSAAVSEDCEDSRNPHLAAVFQYWIQGIGILAIGIPGLIGNFLSAVVLVTSEEMKANVFNYLLSALCLVDSLMIGLCMLDHGIIRGMDQHWNWYGYSFPYFIYPASNIFLCLSTFVVVSIAYERFVAVCRPFAYRVAINTQSPIARSFRLLLPAVILAILINIPKYFETQTVVTTQTMNGTNGAMPVNVTIVHYTVTELRRNPTYIHYYINWFNFLSTGLIPVGLLIFLNGSIYAKIVETTRLREKCRVHLTNKQQVPEVVTVTSSAEREREHVVLSQQDSSAAGNGNRKSRKSRMPHPPNNVSSKDFKMAMIMVAIVMVFLLCHLPRILLNIFEMTFSSKIETCGEKFMPPTWFLCLVSCSNFLVVLNSSINIIIYCVIGEGFRDALARSLKQRLTTMMPNNTSRKTSEEPEDTGNVLVPLNQGGKGGESQDKTLNETNGAVSRSTIVNSNHDIDKLSTNTSDKLSTKFYPVSV